MERPQSKKRHHTGQKKATGASGVCSYLDCLDKIGIPTRTFMVTYCANSILRRCAHEGNGPPPAVSENWARRFLWRHPEYLIRKRSVQKSTEGTYKAIVFSGGCMNLNGSAMSMVYKNAKSTTLTSPDFALVLGRIRRLLHAPPTVHSPSAATRIERQ